MFLLRKKEIKFYDSTHEHQFRSQGYALSGEEKKQVQLYDSYTEYYLPMNMLTQF